MAEQTGDCAGVEVWTQKQLSEWLAERGLKKTGSKNALLNRVLKAQTTNNTIEK